MYFNTCCDSYANYSAFRNIYRSLPLKYFSNLKKIIIVDPSFTVKAIDWFVTGTINKHLHNLTIYVNSLKELKEHKIILTNKKLSLLPPYIIEEKERDIARLSVRESIQQRITLKESPVGQGNQKIPLKLEDYEANEIGVPIALHLMISYFLMRRGVLERGGALQEVSSQERGRGGYLLHQAEVLRLLIRDH